jgi:hypothetical protein
MPEGAVNVTRGTDWGNPFAVGSTVYAVRSWADRPDERGPNVYVDHRLAAGLFRAYVVNRGWVDQIRRELAGKDLVCWCSLDQPCHADVLLELGNG